MLELYTTFIVRVQRSTQLNSANSFTLLVKNVTQASLSKQTGQFDIITQVEMSCVFSLRNDNSYTRTRYNLENLNFLFRLTTFSISLVYH